MDGREHIARMFAALSATNEAILRTRSREELFQRVCEGAVYGGKFVSARVMLAGVDGKLCCGSRRSRQQPACWPGAPS